jgi:hypothetical protein
MTTKNKPEVTLPTIQELHHDSALAVKTDALNTLLNSDPPSSWVKNHPFASGVKYLPIDKVENMLSRIFQEWRAEVIEFKPLFQSISVQVRLHYRNPLTGDWNFQDGLGAVPVKTDKGASAADLSAIKNDAIMTGLPAAESYAIKDAAEKLGRLFGKDLNRKDTIAFQGIHAKGFDEKLQSEAPEGNLPEEVILAIDDAIDFDQLQAIWDSNKRLKKLPEFIARITKRKSEL